jgi:hypothetical protein
MNPIHNVGQANDRVYSYNTNQCVSIDTCIHEIIYPCLHINISLYILVYNNLIDAGYIQIMLFVGYSLLL